MPDLVLVDGRARIDCCKLISEKFPNSIIAFHDFINRQDDGIHDYGKVLEFLEILKNECYLFNKTNKYKLIFDLQINKNPFMIFIPETSPFLCYKDNNIF